MTQIQLQHCKVNDGSGLAWQHQSRCVLHHHQKSQQWWHVSHVWCEGWCWSHQLRWEKTVWAGKASSAGCAAVQAVLLCFIQYCCIIYTCILYIRSGVFGSLLLSFTLYVLSPAPSLPLPSRLSAGWFVLVNWVRLKVSSYFKRVFPCHCAYLEV